MASHAVPQSGSVRHNTWVTASVLTAIMTAAYLDRTIMAFLIEPIKLDLALSDVQVGLLVGAAYIAFYALANVFAGSIVDRVDRRNLLLLAGLVWSGASIACGLSHNYWQLLGARMVLGGAEAFVGPAAYALLRDRIPVQKHGRAFSILGMSPYIGGAGAYMIGGALLREAMAGSYTGMPMIGGLVPWQIVIIAIGILSLLPVVLLLLLKRDGKRGAVDAEQAGFAAALRFVRSHSGAYAILIGYGALGTMIALGSNSWVATMMHRSFEIPLPEVGAIVGQLGLVSGLAGLILCGQVLDRIDKAGKPIRWFAFISCLIAAGGMALMPQMPEAWQAWTLYGIANLSIGAFFPISASILARITPSHLMGKASALFLLFQNVAANAIGITLVALIGEALFSGASALGNALTLYCLALGVATALLALGLDRVAAVAGAADE